MTTWLQNLMHRNGADEATDLIAATPDWEAAASTITVIDIEEFEADHDDPEWLAFCQRADEYLDLVQPQLQAH